MHITPHKMVVLVLVIAPSLVVADDVTGSWEYRGPAESGMWLKTQQQAQTVRFQLELQRGSPSYNSGWIEGAFALRGTSGTFMSSELKGCEISFTFTKRTVQVRQTGDDFTCGFGHAVYADGVLQRKSRLPPNFSQGDPRFGDD